VSLKSDAKSVFEMFFSGLIFGVTFKKFSISDSCDDSLFDRCLLTLSHLINEFLVFSEERIGLVFLEITLSSSIISYKTVLSVE